MGTVSQFVEREICCIKYKQVCRLLLEEQLLMEDRSQHKTLSVRSSRLITSLLLICSDLKLEF